MDTKLKTTSKINIFRFLAFVLAVISGSVFVLSSVFLKLDVIGRDYGKFTESPNYIEEFASLTHNVVELNAILVSSDNIKNNFEEEVQKVKLERFNRIFYNLTQSKNYVYIVRNFHTGEVINTNTTMTIEEIEELNNNVYYNSTESRHNYEHSDSIHRYESSIVQSDYSVGFKGLGSELFSMLANTNIEVYAGVRDEIVPGDAFYLEYEKYSRLLGYQKYIPIINLCFKISLILLLIILIYLGVAARNTVYNKLNPLRYLGKIYNDVHLGILLLISLIYLPMVLSVYGNDILDHWVFKADDNIIFIILIINVIYIMLMVNGFVLFMRQIWQGVLIRQTLLYRAGQKLYGMLIELLGSKKSLLTILILSIVYALTIGLLQLIYLPLSISFILFLINTGIFILLVIIGLSLRRIMVTVENISEGDLEYTLKENEKPLFFRALYNNIKQIQFGMQKAVDEAVKNEKLKTELITNVSHDLKTPLTSIISYTDLLKREELENPVANDYVGVIDTKAARLKTLVEDLIEASKASSGNIQLHKEKINMNVVLHQGLTEYEDKFAARGLDVIVTLGEKPTFIYADGRAIWRVLNNLLSNIEKYAMPNSRVYISVKEEENTGCITMKNVSQSSLNIAPEDLTRRFVRGDVARSTEGSGLGLSIAESLVEAQNGKFIINIDADLFSISCCMPLWIEKKDVLAQLMEDG